MYEEMIVTGAWWDYVDAIAGHRLGLLLRRFPAEMRREMLAWSRSDDLWKRRSAILCQLTFEKDTDLDLLYATIEPALASKEFFLQKGHRLGAAPVRLDGPEGDPPVRPGAREGGAQLPLEARGAEERRRKRPRG